MNTKIKKLSLTGLIAVAFLCLICALAPFFAGNTDKVYATGSRFEMRGASIRYDVSPSDNGIRFHVVMDKTQYDALGSKETGLLIIPAYKLGGATLTINTVGAYNTLTEFGHSLSFETITSPGVGESADDMESIVVIKGFNASEDYYNARFVVRGFIKDGGSYTYTENVSQKSLADVAKEFDVSTYILEYDIEFFDEDGKAIGKQTVEFGEDFEIPAYSVVANGCELRWYKRIGGTTTPVWSEDPIDLGEESLTVTKNAQYKATTVENVVRYSTTLYNKENIYGGDPSITYRHGYYYYCFESRYGISVLKAQSLEELLEAGLTSGAGSTDGWGHINKASLVWDTRLLEDGDALGADIWAPELIYLRGKWYIYACGVPKGQTHGENGYEEQMYVLECEGQDPTGTYKAPVKVTPTAFNNKYTIDGHAFEYKGQLYYVFSGDRGAADTKPQLYMCTMNSPTSVNNDAVMINKDANTSNLKEGPCTVVDGDDLYLIYSCGSHDGRDYNNDNDYHLEYYKLNLSKGGNPMTLSHWDKKGSCLTHDSTKGIYSVGHNHIFTNYDGSLWTSYHGVVGTADAGTDAYLAKRRVFVQPISVENGALDFGGVQTTVVTSDKCGLQYANLDRTEYKTDGVGSGRLWKNNGDDFFVKTTITRGADGQFHGGVTLYERTGNGYLNELLIGIGREGNVFFCNYYSGAARYYRYEHWAWTDTNAIRLKVTYNGGSTAATSTIKIDIAKGNGSSPQSWTYTLAEINALVADKIGGDDVGQPFDLAFTGNFEIGLGGNSNVCTFTDVVVGIGGVLWNDAWGSSWNPYA